MKDVDSRGEGKGGGEMGYVRRMKTPLISFLHKDTISYRKIVQHEDEIGVERCSLESMKSHRKAADEGVADIGLPKARDELREAPGEVHVGSGVDAEGRGVGDAIRRQCCSEAVEDAFDEFDSRVLD